MKAIKGKFFFRGAHVRGEKSLSEGCSIQPLQNVKEVSISLSRHIGKPSLPVVEVGQAVKRGQLIGKADGCVSANVHASISGTVTAIAPVTDGSGATATYVTIARSETDETDFLPPLSDPTQEQIISRVQEAGIVGMGGAGFPTHVKLKPSVPVDTLILNGAECEPYLTCDHRLMLERTEQIVRGAHYLAKAIGATKIFIGIERNKPDAIALFENTDLQVVSLKKQYPMGSEKHIIYCCTGRKVPVGKLPADVGVIVQNVATTLAVCEAIEEGKPLIERVVTVSGGGVSSPKNLLCPLGASLTDLISACGGEHEVSKIVAGGPMTGVALLNTTSYVSKTSGGFLLLKKEEINDEEPTPCINCGKCADVCPMKLMPMQTAFFCSVQDYEKCERYGGVLSCIECGACSYICPARRPLMQSIRTAKAELRKQRQGGAK